jgi:hypothetical protein
MTSPLNNLRVQVTAQQRAILTTCWKHYCENGEWIDVRLLYHNEGGRPVVEGTLADLGGTIIFEQGDGTTTRYILTFLGILLSEESTQYEQLVAQYLGYLVALTATEPVRDYVGGQEVAAALHLTPEQSTTLGNLIQLGNFTAHGMGGYKTSEWNASVLTKTDTLPLDLIGYVQTRAMASYDPDMPVSEMPRSEYRRNQNVTESAERSGQKQQEPMNVEEHNLFEEDLFELRKKNQLEMSKELQAYDKDSLFSMDIDEVCAYLVDTYGLKVPVLSNTYTALEPVEVSLPRKDTRVARNLGLRYINGIKIEYAVPFTGDAALFDYKTEINGFNPVRGGIVGNELRLSYLVRPDADSTDTARMHNEFQEDLALIRKYLDWNREDADTFNAELARLARDVLLRRRGSLINVTNSLTNLGIPIRRRDDAPETAPVERRKLPIRKPGSQQNPGQAPLPMEEYEHIIHVMTNMAIVMERSPQAFEAMGEEHLRIHFLVQLNGQYEGQATGETFNLAGKTDILIRIGNQNIFIAECKYWTGEQGLLDAIDQLLGYLTWRDTKAAIVLFNKNKNPSRVIRQIPDILRKHPSFIEQLSNDSDSGFRCHLRHTEDTDKEVLLTVLVFNVPTAEQA